VLDRLLQDARYALRWIARSPGFTLIAVASLGLGIGFNTTLFSVVDAILFRPLPVERPDRLVEVYTSGEDGDTYATSSYPDYLDIRARSAVFADLAGYSPMMAAVSQGDRARVVLGEVVTGNYFGLLGVGAAVGRTLLPGDDLPGAPRVAMISHRAWHRDHAGDPTVIGRTLRLRGEPYTIVGVAPAAFTGMLPMLAPEIWVPVAHVMEFEPAGIQDVVPSPGGTHRLDRRGQRWMFVKGRLRDDATLEQARANLAVIMAQLTAEHPQTNRDRRITVEPTRGVRVHPDADRALLPVGLGLMLAVGLVLLVACANVASLLLARATARAREMGIRLALGAGRAQLVRQLLTESVLLAALGAGAGLLLALALQRAVTTLPLPLPVPLAFDLRLDLRVFAFTAAVSLGAGLLAGLAPALRGTRRDLVTALRGESRATSVAGRRWTARDVLVAGQMAVTIVLLVVAALLGRSLLAAQRADPGFATGGLAVVAADPEMLGYERDAALRFWERAVERVRAAPGVESVALASRLPFSLNFGYDMIFVPGHHAAGDRAAPTLSARVSADYFATIGVPLVEGRAFTSFDTPQTPAVVVVSEAFARRYWPEGPVLGRRIHLRGPDGPAFEIVGVSADHKVRTIGEAPQPYVHFAQAQQPSTYQVLVARTRGDARRAVGDARAALLDVEPNLVLLEARTMEDLLAGTLLPARLGAWIVAVVGCVALVLAAIGLYGVIAYSVARRTRDIGIRMALGARPSRVLGQVMRQGLALTAAGIAAGVVLAVIAARAVGGLLYGIGAADPLAWLGAVLVVVVISTIANLVPARRASRIDPFVALRTE
jgi:macrolide transport system ATP-binding/permease protein